jgi:hypothetical protein
VTVTVVRLPARPEPAVRTPGGQHRQSSGDR